ncbi:MAG TPA: hypothetical protein PKA41_03010 [Verrucomicrobiota bacterium]|nr:hypothetical protein [Verrucomicrobiota bacterium]
MKSYKLSLIALMAGGLLAVGPSLFAQDTGDRPRNRPGGGFGGGMTNVQERVQRIAEELKLTDEQKTKITGVLESQVGKMRALREDQSLSQEQRREKGREIREEVNKQVKEILTPEQYAKWEQMRPQGGGRGQGGPGGPDGQRPPRPEGGQSDQKPADAEKKPADAAK